MEHWWTTTLQRQDSSKNHVFQEGEDSEIFLEGDEHGFLWNVREIININYLEMGSKINWDCCWTAGAKK